MKTIRCRMTVLAKTEHNYGHDVELTAVTATNEETAQYFEATPAGSLKLSLLNAKAAEAIEVGRDYYIDLVPVPKD